MVGNLLEIVKNVVISLYNKQNDTCLLVDMSCIELNSQRYSTERAPMYYLLVINPAYRVVLCEAKTRPTAKDNWLPR